jgi:Fe-S cluster biogenesis protein NfuA
VTVDAETVASAVDEVAAFLRADGGDLVLLEADPRTARIRLALVLDGVTCDDCVLPPEQLHETIAHALADRIPGEFELLIADPRRVP